MTNEPNAVQYQDARAHVPCAMRFIARAVGERYGAYINKRSWDAEVGAWVIKEYRQRPLLPEDMCDPGSPASELAVEVRVYPRSPKDAKAVFERLEWKLTEKGREAAQHD